MIKMNKKEKIKRKEENLFLLVKKVQKRNNNQNKIKMMLCNKYNKSRQKIIKKEVRKKMHKKNL
jgi:hypothetical protein